MTANDNSPLQISDVTASLDKLREKMAESETQFRTAILMIQSLTGASPFENAIRAQVELALHGVASLHQYLGSMIEREKLQAELNSGFNAAIETRY